MDEMIIDENKFIHFVENHRIVKDNGIVFVVENNKLMTNSYLMIDPLGRFYDNSGLKLNYSKPILEIGYQEAMNEVFVNEELFLARGGKYDY